MCSIALHLHAHELQYLRQTRLPVTFWYLSHFKIGAKNADIGVAVNRNTVDAEIETEDLGDRAVERVVVNGVAAIEQRAVYIEQVAASSTPVKTRLNMHEPLRRRFGNVRSCPARLQFRW